MKTKRIIINSSDIAHLYGCSIRTAQKKLKRAKKDLKKPDGITFKEYARYYHLPVEEVLENVF